MISKIFNSVFNFMSNPYVVVILTIITDVFMVMVDGIHSLGDVVLYTIIMPIILMLAFKCVPYVIAFGVGVVFGLVYLILSWVVMIIRFVFNVK